MSAPTGSAPALAPPQDEVYGGVWWLSPPGAVALVVPVTLGLAAGYSSSDFQTYFRTAKSLTTGTAVLLGAGALVFVLGSLVAQVGRKPARRGGAWPWLRPGDLAVLRRASTVLFRVTMVGYASFVVVGLRNGVRPGDVLQAVVTQDVSNGDLEEAVGTLPGVTTLTQVGVAYSVVAFLLLLHGRDRTQLRRLAVLGALSLARAFLFTERLALVEVAVPALALVLVHLSHTATPLRRTLLRLAPIPLVALLVVGFAASEYSRSYNFYKTVTDDSLLVFASKRLSGYYATAYNNGQLSLTHDRYVGRLPYSSVEAVWTAPGVEQLDLYDRLVGRDSRAYYDSILLGYGNPEFNNPGGLAAPFVDFGRVGGLAAFLVLGLGAGLAYRGFVDGRLEAVLLYPVVVTGLLEMPRFLYWTLGRVVPTVLALLLVALAVRRSARRRPTVVPAAGPSTLPTGVLAVSA